MRFEIKQKHYVSIAIGVVIIILDFALFFNFVAGEFGSKVWYFNPIFVTGALIAASTFIMDFLNETKRQKEIELKFLEFVRSLTESVRSGITIPQAIVRVAGANYGSLTPYVRKLSHQIEWGFPLHKTLTTFANDTGNEIIKRAISIIIQANRSGGDMASVLESITGSTYEIKKIKEEQKTGAYSQIIQGYIIFFVFIATMLVLQIYLVPKMSDIGTEIAGGIGGMISMGGAGTAGQLDLYPIFIATVIVQGLFAGLLLGKFAEGDFKSGFKHSLIMVVTGYLIISTANGLVGAAPLIFIIKEKIWKREE